MKLPKAKGDTYLSALTSARLFSNCSYVLKLDVDGQIDSFHLFLSPRQVHLLLDMLAAIAGPGKYDSAGISPVIVGTLKGNTEHR